MAPYHHHQLIQSAKDEGLLTGSDEQRLWRTLPVIAVLVGWFLTFVHGAAVTAVSVNRKNELEESMLLNLSKRSWTAGLTLTNFQQHNESNEKVVKELKALADRYDKVREGVQHGKMFDTYWGHLRERIGFRAGVGLG